MRPPLGKKRTRGGAMTRLGGPLGQWGWGPLGTAGGLLHAWETKDCSLLTNALVYAPPCAPRIAPLTGAGPCGIVLEVTGPWGAVPAP